MSLMTQNENNNELVRLIVSSSTTLSLSQILPNYDGNSFENATTLYRKPSYQRTLKKDVGWCIKLIESVLKGFTTGSITMSEWTTIAENDNGVLTPYTYYNIEDGQTRLDAYERFIAGEFETRYGSYEDVRQIFDNYQHSIIIQRKVNSNITDRDYFSALQENFSLLQEGTPLTASDRYWAWIRDDNHNYAGSPLVNYTVYLVNEHNELSNYFQNILSIGNLSNRNTNQRNNRQMLASMISMVSGAIWGAEYSNCKYFTHIELLNREITYEEKDFAERLLQAIFTTINMALENMPRVRNEKIALYFNKPKKFIASMLEAFRLPILHNDTNVIADKINCYVNLINHFRTAKLNLDNNWLVNNVYNDLSAGSIRNLTQTDIIARTNAIAVWWNNIHQ